MGSVRDITHTRQNTKQALPRGVSFNARNGSYYWLARTGGSRPKYFGEGEEAKALAVAARQEYERRREARKRIKGLEKAHLHEDAKLLKRTALELKTVPELCEWYLSLEEVQKLRSYNRTQAMCFNLSTYFGKTSLVDIETESLRDYHKWRKQAHEVQTEERDYITGEVIVRTIRPGHNRTISAEIAALMRAIQTAIDEKKLPEGIGPGKKPKLYDAKTEDILRRPVKDGEYQLLLDACINPDLRHRAPDQDFHDYMTVAWETAMRSGEVGQIRKGWIHLDAVISEVPYRVMSYIDIPQHITKSRYERIVPISDDLREVVERRMEGLKDGDRLFPGYGLGRVSHKFRFCCQRVGIEYGDKVLDEDGELKLTPEGYRVGLVFHCFRATRISKWIEAGFSDEIIRKASGHKSLEAYRRYVKLDKWAVARLTQPNGTIKTAQNQAQSVDNTG